MIPLSVCVGGRAAHRPHRLPCLSCVWYMPQAYLVLFLAGRESSLRVLLSPAPLSLSTRRAGRPWTRWRSSSGTRWTGTSARPARNWRLRWRQPSTSISLWWWDKVGLRVFTHTSAQHTCALHIDLQVHLHKTLHIDLLVHLQSAEIVCGMGNKHACVWHRHI